MTRNERQKRIEFQEMQMAYLKEHDRQTYNKRSRNYESAKKKYNEIMFCICHEFATIGTDFSEDTDGWNIRDMVAEADYCLSCYYESGHADNEMKYEDYKRWVSETGKLKRFIKHWAQACYGIRCIDGHCSKFDNYNKKEDWKEIPKEYEVNG